jgi:hypothetical protein
MRNFDPGRRAKNIKAAFFHASAANDFFGWPEAVQATLNEIPGEKNQVYAPNCNHSIKVPGGTVFPETNSKGAPGKLAGNRANWLAMEVPYFDYHLKGQGDPMPRVRVEKGASPFKVKFHVQSALPLTKAEVYWAKPFAPEALKDPDRLREAELKREWIAVPAEGSVEKGYEAELPGEAAIWFALVSDSRPVSVSSELMTIPETQK